MSNEVFPTNLPGLKWGSVKAPLWSTAVRETPSMREYRTRFALYPRYLIKLSYEVLREKDGLNELQQLMGFFNQRNGSFDTFLLSDPDDNSVTAAGFGIGNGTTTAYQLVRAYGGFAEPIYDVNGAPQIYRSDWQGNQLLYSTPRTNHLARSEELDNAYWTKSNATVTANAGVAPDGTTTADALVEDTTTSGHSVNRSITITPGATVAVSVYVKRQAGARHMRIDIASSSNGARVYVDLDAGTIAAAGASSFGTGSYVAGSAFVQPLPGGWFRVGLAGRVDPASTFAQAVFYLHAVPSGSALYTGDGASSLLFWGTQFEMGSVIGAYIRTTTAAVTVTDYTLSSTGLVTFAAAPLSGALLTWTGSYYFRVRFKDDSIEFAQFLYKLWEARRVDLITVKP